MNKFSKAFFDLPAAKILFFLLPGAALFLYCAKFVPFNMDEFIQYHAMACHLYPLNELNTFRESCGDYHLTIFPGVTLPLLSYIYVGSFFSAFYYPLLLLWNSPYSGRLVGIFALLLQVFLAGKLFKINKTPGVYFLTGFILYAFPHVVDTGPVSFHTTSIFLILFIFEKWIRALKENRAISCVYAALIGLIVFASLWIKVAYLFILPSLLGLMAAGAFTSLSFAEIQEKRIAIARDFLAGAVIGGGLSGLLLFARTGYGNFYFTNITQAQTLAWTDMPAWIKQVKILMPYWLNPMTIANQAFSVAPRAVTFEGVGLLIFLAGMLILGFQSRRKHSGFHIPFWACLGAFALSTLLTFKSVLAVGPHHFVLSLPFLILAILHGFRDFKWKSFAGLFLVLFLSLNGLLFVKLIPQPLRADLTHPSLSKLNRVLRSDFSKAYVYVVVDWGMYYLQSLYGNKDQCVLYISPLDDEKQMRKLQEILQKTHRKALFIGRADTQGDLPLARKFFPALEEMKMDFDSGPWKIWREPLDGK